MDIFITICLWTGGVIAALVFLSAAGKIKRIAKGVERLVELKERELSFFSGVATEAADQIEADEAAEEETE